MQAYENKAHMGMSHDSTHLQEQSLPLGQAMFLMRSDESMQMILGKVKSVRMSMTILREDLVKSLRQHSSERQWLQ